MQGNSGTTPSASSQRSTGEGFYQGFAAPWRGWRLIAAHRTLWPHVVLPVLINIALTLLVFFVLAAVAVWFAVHAHPWFHEEWRAGWGLGYVLEILFAIALLIGAA